MARKSDRLFRIVTMLQGRRTALTAARIAEQLEVSVRTVYRDIQDLMLSGVPIAGEAGTGYMMDRRYHLPPIMFDDEEIECLVLGMAMVGSWTDLKTSGVARRTLAKLRGTMGTTQRETLGSVALFAPASGSKPPWTIDFSEIRRCIRERYPVAIAYADEAGAQTERTVRPLALAFFGPVWVMSGWCELREDFRNFRLDRIGRLTVLEAPFREERGKTLRDYLKTLPDDVKMPD
jgi:predicted DNA-binding transcriptional regulator YafY